MTLHSVAARWIYSFVPYDDGTQALSGVRIGAAFGWQRDHFDRLVHFSYGACLGPVLFRFLLDRGRRVRWAALVAVDVVLSTSALYELFEWGIAMTLAPGAAEAYNGQQGDLGDAQKGHVVRHRGSIVGGRNGCGDRLVPAAETGPGEVFDPLMDTGGKSDRSPARVRRPGSRPPLV